MSQHPDNTPTPDTLDQQPEWEIWVDMFAPRRRKVLMTRRRWDPVPEDCITPEISRRSVRFTLDALPPLDLGSDAYGTPIIAYEAVLDVIVVDPDGTERVVQRHSTDSPALIGAEALCEYEERQWEREDGVIERWRGPDGLKRWAWNEGGVPDPHCLIVDRDAEY
jgi:hypothetical protein